VRLSYQTKRAWTGFLFTLPWVIGSLIFFVAPMVLSFLFSINDVDAVSFKFTYIGFEQYKEFFVGNAEFLPGLTKAVSDMLLSVVMVMFFSLFIANILVSNFRGSRFFQTIFFLPFIISTSLVISIITGTIDANADAAQSTELQLTIFRSILSSLNLGADISTTLETMLNSMLNISWKCGLQIVLFMAALRNISASVREAALIEGATPWEFFWKIAFPMISPIFQLNLIYSVIDSFTDRSNGIVAWIDSLANSLELTASTTLAYIYYGLVFIIIAILLFFLRKRIFYYTD